LPDYDLTISTGLEVDALQNSIFINCSSVSFTSAYELISNAIIAIIANSTITAINSTFEAELLWMQSDAINLTDTNISNDNGLVSNCNCVNQQESCQINFPYFPYLYSTLVYNSTFSMAYLNVSF
jgi:hypothetical protein